MAQGRNRGLKKRAGVSKVRPEPLGYADGFVRRLRPSVPVAWFATLMGNGDNEHSVRQHFVHNGIREAADQQPSKSAIAGHS